MRFPLDLSSLGNAFLFGTTLFGAFIVALWVSLVFWTYRDSRTRTQEQRQERRQDAQQSVLCPCPADAVCTEDKADP